MAEERRLMYVGLTRAKDRLFLTYAFRRTRYGESEPMNPSCFLDDLPSELVIGSWRARQRSSQRAVTWQPQAAIPRTARPQFRSGQRVEHAVFGEGLVIESRADGDDEIVTVAFEEVGLKRLMVGLAPLERLEG